MKWKLVRYENKDIGSGSIKSQQFFYAITFVLYNIIFNNRAAGFLDHHGSMYFQVNESMMWTN